MLWSTIESTLISEAKRITGYDSAHWEGQPTGWQSDSLVRLALVSLEVVGRDELRQSCPDPTQIDYRVYGVRRFVVQFTVETQSQALATSALVGAEKLAASLAQCPTTCDNLAAAEIATGQVRPMKVMDYCDCDGRKRSAVVFEVFFNTHSSIPCSSVPTVDKVVYTVNVDDVDGSPVLSAEDITVSTP